MATEIERKFLVHSDQWKASLERQEDFLQGYLANNDSCSIRVRISGGKAKLNIKSSTLGISRSEYDYTIPIADGQELLQQLCGKPVIEKTRHYVKHGRHLWEVDVFEGENAGLVVAEIELGQEDEDFEKPDWAGQEVTEDARYYTASLQVNPYRNW
ncbi:MAG: CYTH domain-containing protein [Gammaproteobacteria bacterium]|nr:CYTH domain-containing protein [Gammaproteobacteria bacterium]